MEIKLVCSNCKNEEILNGDTSNFALISYSDSQQISVEGNICGNITDCWTYESTMD